MNYISDIKLETNDAFNVIIEIPIGTNHKYELADGTFDRLIDVRKVKGRYPFYYGCFAQTLAGDNDPLDMILLSKKKRNKLDVVEVYLLGAIKTVDNGEIDDKIIVVPKDECMKDFRKLEKLALKFLSKYKGKNSNTITDLHIYDAEEAHKLVNEAHKAYKAKNKSAIKVVLN